MTQKNLYTVVMVRHGQSVANLQNTYSGWDDVLLTEEGETNLLQSRYRYFIHKTLLVSICRLSHFTGVEQARQAGKILRKAGYKFDVAHTSMLTRAQKTLDLILEELGQRDIPVHKTWRLNERNFGEFTGLTHAEVLEKFGSEKVSLRTLFSSCIAKSLQRKNVR